MPSAIEVTPEKWNDIKILLDNDWYSAIWGYYNGESHKSLGVRWNGENGELGFPNARGYPTWFVEPEFLSEAILLRILNEHLSRPGATPNNEYIKNVLEALQELYLRKHKG